GNRPVRAFSNPRHRSLVVDVQEHYFLARNQSSASAPVHVHQVELRLECATVALTRFNTLQLALQQVEGVMGPRQCDMDTLSIESLDSCMCLLHYVHSSCELRPEWSQAHPQTSLQPTDHGRAANRMIKAFLPQTWGPVVTGGVRLRLEQPLNASRLLFVNRTSGVRLQDQLCVPGT